MVTQLLSFYNITILCNINRILSRINFNNEYYIITQLSLELNYCHLVAAVSFNICALSFLV